MDKPRCKRHGLGRGSCPESAQTIDEDLRVVKSRIVGLILIGMFISGGVALYLRNAPRPNELWQAAAEGDTTRVIRLLDNGTPLDVADSWDGTALMYAAGNGHAPLVALLLDRGANINEQRRLKRTALMWAAFGGHAETVRLLVARGASTTLRDAEGATALTLAQRAGHRDVAQLLAQSR